jgi:hypothetical protein
MIDQMKSTDKVVDLSSPVVDMKSGEKKTIYIAFKNTDSTTKNFTINTVTATSLQGSSGMCGLDSTSNNYIEYKNTKTLVNPRTTLVLPINIKSNNNAQGSCFYELDVVEGNNLYGSCEGTSVYNKLWTGTCSSEIDSSHPCTHSYDNDITSYWYFSNNNNILFDLGQKKCFNKTNVSFDTQTINTGVLNIDAGDNTSSLSYVTDSTFQMATSYGIEQQLSTEYVAKYVKFRFSYAYWAKIYDVNIYSRDFVPPPSTKVELIVNFK